jgi:hypothetical protein
MVGAPLSPCPVDEVFGGNFISLSLLMTNRRLGARSKTEYHRRAAAMDGFAFELG